jgi:ATP-dependent RNA helicase HrpA
MAGEIVETSQLFARTVAGIDPLWIIEFAPHLCQVSYGNPHWSVSSGRVLVEEKTTLYGLELRKRNVAYGNIDSKEATQIFIRAALVEGPLLPEPTPGKHEQDEASLSASQLLALASAQTRPPRLVYPFLEHNQRVRHKIETWQTRMRRHDLGDLDQALVEFYSKRVENVSSIYELNRLLREHPEPGFLCVTESDLTDGRDLTFDAEAFPDAVSLGDRTVTLSYSYSPGEEHDGVTLKLASHLAQTIPASVLEWSVPGLREAQVTELLRSLPKAIRRQLMPLSEKASEIARNLRPTASSLREDLSDFIRRRYGIAIPITAWRADSIPQHLRPRIELLDHYQKTIGAGRDPSQLIRQIETAKTEPAALPPAWIRATAHWERFGLTAWTFGDLPERLVVEVGPAPFSSSSPSITAEKVKTDPDAHSHLCAWPGLQLDEGQVNLRLFKNLRDARQASLGGVQRLIELALEKDLAWLQKDLRGLCRLAPLYAGFCSGDALQATACINLRRYLLPNAPFDRLTRANFDLALAQARPKLPGLAIQLIDRVEAILKVRQEILRRFGQATHQVPSPPRTARTTPAPAQPYTLTGLNQLVSLPSPTPRQPSLVHIELNALLPANFLERIEFERLSHIPRYLRALLTRAERARLNPAKDQQRAQQLAPYQHALRALEAAEPASEASKLAVREFRFMIEEFKVSLFAQELGTAFPISPKRLDRYLEATRSRLHLI